MIKYAPPLSEVVYWSLEVAVGALKKTHTYALCIYLKKIKKIEQYHKLLLVLGGDLALTRSYSERWQVA